MATEVQICNIALSRIGQNQGIDSLAEKSQAAALCDLHYEQCRDDVLSEFDWPFAESRIFLADLGSPPEAWGYRYAYPADCLKARYIALPGMENPPAQSRIPFKVVNAGNSRAVLTNQEQAELVYTMRVTNTGLFSSPFVSALAWRIAAELAMGLTSKPDNYAAAMNSYRVELMRAQALSYEQSQESEPPESEFERVRY